MSFMLSGKERGIREMLNGEHYATDSSQVYTSSGGDISSCGNVAYLGTKIPMPLYLRKISEDHRGIEAMPVFLRYFGGEVRTVMTDPTITTSFNIDLLSSRTSLWSPSKCKMHFSA
jgi:hypothetical protein